MTNCILITYYYVKRLLRGVKGDLRMNLKKIFLTGAIVVTTPFTSIGTAQASIIFKDVPTGHWSYKAILDLTSKNIVSGYGNGISGFGDDVTREQYVQFLYNATLPYEERPGANQEPKRFANCKEANDAGFYDITRDSPYYGKHLDRDGDGIACEREKSGK